MTKSKLGERVVRRWAVFWLWLPMSAFGMVEETGSLYGFLIDTCANCSYDNWLSHVSERNIRANYNDYGPPNLDPVTNGFGSFTFIPENSAGDSALAHWRQLFQFAIAKDWHSVDSMTALYQATWNYEFVHLWEQSRRKEYYLLRERLDSSFVDTNGDNTDSNDVIGGFRKGWGVFVFNPSPRHPYAIIQVPHPEDDYVAPPVAMDMFIRDELALLMIAGAGREVMWDSVGHSIYNNSLSLSDPSRNGRHPFAVLTEVAKDAWDAPPYSQFIVLQLHSYDHNEHAALGDLQLSCFHDDTSPDMPIRDPGFHLYFIHALCRFPVNGFDGDSVIVTPVNEYVSLWCNPQYSFFGADTVPIRSINDFLGALENQQALYCHETHDNFRDNENFVHIEMDEYPDALWQPEEPQRWLPGYPPARLSNFRKVIDYYSAFVNAVDSMLIWNALPDTLAPLQPRIVRVSPVGINNLRIEWNPPARDPHFDTYQIFYDTTAITLASPSITRVFTLAAALSDPATQSQTVYNLLWPLDRYRFAIRAWDSGDRYTALSTEWGIIDSVIHDLTIRVVDDSLELSWTAQYYDTLYEIREYVQDSDDYYLIGTTPANSFTITQTATDHRVHIIKVKRIIRL